MHFFLFNLAKRISVLYLVLCYVVVYDLLVVHYYRNEFNLCNVFVCIMLNVVSCYML